MYTVNIFRGLKHGFLTRQGGVSEGYFDSLNFALTKGDDTDKVFVNRNRGLAKLGLSDKKLMTLQQVHGTDVVIAKNGWDFNIGNTPNADAIIT